MAEEEFNHIQLAVNFTDIVKTTLGPRGMNKMIVADGKIKVLTNDGATIVGNLKGGNPITDLFKQLAKSQEEAIGDGTTTAIILAGSLLKNAQKLIDKGIHPTTIINGYNIALANAINFLSATKEKPDKEKIMRTAFGTKISPDLVDRFINLLNEVEDPKNLRVHKILSSDSSKSEIFKGYVMKGGFTRDEQMNQKIDGRIAILNFPVNVKWNDVKADNVKDLREITDYDISMKRDVVDKLKEMNVEWVFYTDTCKEFDAYLTDADISGVAIFRPEDIDAICMATGSKAITDEKLIDENHIGTGKVEYKKGADSNEGAVYVSGNAETLILHGSTPHLLDEIERSEKDYSFLKRYEVHSAAQILLKFVLENELVDTVIPATSDLSHVKENISVSDSPKLSEKD